MDKNDIDQAFEWLVVIFGIITAILIQYPEYFYMPSPGGPTAGLVAAIWIVPPMVLTVVIWLIGKLAERASVQALAKVAAWMLITSSTWLCLWMYFLGVLQAAWGVAPTSLLINVGLLVFFALSPVVTWLVVAPKYRRMYPSLPLLLSKWRLLGVYSVTQAFMCLWISVTRSRQF